MADSRTYRFFCLAALALPALVFLLTQWRYAANVPYWDDITQILWMLNQVLTSDGSSLNQVEDPDALHALFYPNAGHIPLLTRLFGLLQFALGGMDFRVAMAVAGGAWVLGFCGLLWEARRSLPLPALIPLPFLAFSLSQWEAMNMMLGSWQMYVGTLLLPLGALAALVRGHPLLAGGLFAAGLFGSAGALAVMPLALAWCLLQRQWRQLGLFLLLALPALLWFLHCNPQQAPRADGQQVLDQLYFAAVFLGNIYGAGSYDLKPLAPLHLATGCLLLALGVTALFLNRRQPLFQLVFLYTLLLALMTALKRSEQTWVVPRYSVFALLCAASVYVLWMDLLQRQWQLAPAARHVVLAVATAASLALWLHNYPQGSRLLAQDQVNRQQALRAYAEEGDCSRLMWDPLWCRDTLESAKKLGLFDYQRAAAE